MKKSIIYLVIAIASLVVLAFVYWWQRGDVLPVQPPSDAPGRGSASLNSNATQDVSGEIIAQDVIRDFMAAPDVELQLVDTRKNPSNFTVGKVTEIKTDSSTVSGGWVMDTPPEWERPVAVYQQTGYINELCEVYEYEIDVRNNQLVEVHVVYPQVIQELPSEEQIAKCNTQGSLYTPLKNQGEIEAVAQEYLRRVVPNYDTIQSDFIYKPSKKDPTNVAAAHEWFWQDTSYQLPEGLTGDVYNYPTIRIIVSSGGKLIHYFNSTGLFN